MKRKLLLRTVQTAMLVVPLAFLICGSQSYAQSGDEEEDPLEGIDIYGGEGEDYDMPDVTKPAKKKKKRASMGLAIIPGYAYVIRSGDTGEILGNGHELGMYLRYILKRKGKLRFGAGLAARYATFENELSAPVGGATASKASGTNVDTSLVAAIIYRLSGKLYLVTDVGPSVVHHNMVIQNEDLEIADDYHANYGFGYVLQPGLEYRMKLGSFKPLFRLYLRLAGGQEIMSGKLKYNGETVDINEMQFAAGLDVGVTL